MDSAIAMDSEAVDAGLLDSTTDVLEQDSSLADGDPPIPTDLGRPDMMLDSAMEADAMVFPPPLDPTPEIDCDALDNDGDGVVDEGVANLCGGCGEIPEGGCQHWRVNLIQDGEGALNPNRIVGLSGTILEPDVLEIDNGTCQIVRLVSRQSEGADIGAVDIQGSQSTWTLTPVLDQQSGLFRYGSNEPVADEPLFRDGDRVAVTAEGGSLVQGFDHEVVAPLSVAETTDFSPLFDALRGSPSDETLRLGWRPNLASNGQMKLYIGGSLVTFRPSNTYQAIEHFVLDGQLIDDGELVLPGDFFGVGVPGSSVWLYLIREGGQRLVLGPHAVTIPIGRRVEARTAGGVSLGDAPPFSILSPDPNERRFVPGEDLPVSWSALPDGAGPLDLRFSSRNPETNVQSLVSCIINDPSLGAATLPAALTSQFSSEIDVFNQITLRWVLHRRQLPGPDRGTFQHSASVILNLSQ